MNSDILIIGGGVIGLAIARELHKKGVDKITVVERGQVGREASWAAAGILAPQAETDRLDDFYRMCSASKDLYPRLAEELLDETRIDIELDRSGTLYLAFNEEDAADIRKRFEWQKARGLEVERCSGKDSRSIEPRISERVMEGLFFPNDWQVENRKLLTGLIKYARLNEIKLIEETKVDRVLTKGGRATGIRTIDDLNFLADVVILATGAWTALIKIGELAVPIDVKPIRGQMICFKPRNRQFRRVIYSPRGYLVPRYDGRVLAGATVEDAGFDADTTENGITSLRAVASEIAPGLADLETADKWAGLRPFAADGRPVIGGFSPVDNLFVATGHYRNGILLAPFTAKVIADLVTENRISEFLPSFSPQRFRFAGSGR